MGLLLLDTPAAGGGTTYDMSGAIACEVTVAGILTAKLAMAGAAAVDVPVAGVVTLRMGMSGAAVVETSVAGVLTAALGMSGESVVVVVVDGTMTGPMSLSGSVAIVVVVDGALSGVYPPGYGEWLKVGEVVQSYYLDTELTNGYGYRYKVKAVGGSGQISDFSVESDLVVPLAGLDPLVAPPNDPTDDITPPGSYTGGSISGADTTPTRVTGRSISAVPGKTKKTGRSISSADSTPTPVTGRSIGVLS